MTAIHHHLPFARRAASAPAEARSRKGLRAALSAMFEAQDQVIERSGDDLPIIAYRDDDV